MRINGEQLKRWLSFGQRDIYSLLESLRDKGPKYFSRALALAGIMIGVSFFIASRPLGQLKKSKSDLIAATSIAKVVKEYEDLQDKLNSLYSRLPRSNDPGTWLLNSVRESLKQEGIIPTSFTSPVEERSIGYRIFTISTHFDANYQQTASWAARIEQGQAPMFIKSLSLSKKSRSVGINNVDVNIATVFSDTLGPNP